MVVLGNGHSEALQWARANAYPRNVSTCYYVAENGPLEVLQCARAKTDVHLLRRARENRYPSEEDDDSSSYEDI